MASASVFTFGGMDGEKDKRWSRGASTMSRSFGFEAWSYTQHEKCHLQLLQKKEPPTNRRAIPATLLEKLAFLRTYTASMGRTHIFYMQVSDVSRYIFMQVLSAIMFGLTSAYRIMFMSSYSPEEHCYVSKMVPLFYGATIQLILCGLIDLTMTMEPLYYFWDYFMYGVIDKAPWTRCSQENFTFYKNSVRCYTVDEFIKVTKNKTPELLDTWWYETKSDNTSIKFQMAPAIFYRLRRNLLNLPLMDSRFVYYALVTWVVAVLLQNTLYSRYTWKILHYVHIAVNAAFIYPFIFLLWSFLEYDIPVKEVPDSIIQKSKEVAGIDFDLLAISYFAPPLLHILTARSSAEIHPSIDSGIVTLSNTIFSIALSLLSYKLRHYCEYMINATIRTTRQQRYPMFVLWTIFYSQKGFGALYCVIFFMLNYFENLIDFCVTFQFLVETVICEWPFLNRRVTAIGLAFLAFIPSLFSTLRCRIILYIFVKSFTILMEVLIINFFYPLGRLIDDMTFHYGTPPIGIRVWSLRLIPIYFGVKVWIMIDSFFKAFNTKKFATQIKLAYIVSFLPILLGMIMAIFKLLIKGKQNWRALLRPSSIWGPREHVTRQLRKQYDAREHITSQGSRYLSRHLMAKAGPQTYRLDIKYELPSTRTTNVSSGKLNRKFS